MNNINNYLNKLQLDYPNYKIEYMSQGERIIINNIVLKGILLYDNMRGGFDLNYQSICEAIDNQFKINNMKKRTFTEPFLIQMTSGQFNKQCDILPHGSIHTVKKDEEGYLWLTTRTDSVPKDYGIKVLMNKPDIKTCNSCKNEFPTDWPFMTIDNVETCIRCYERKYLPNREEYRIKIREELSKELNNEK